MLSVEKCPICGGEIVIKEVDKLLRAAEHTAILKVSAEVYSKLWRTVVLCGNS